MPLLHNVHLQTGIKKHPNGSVISITAVCGDLPVDYTTYVSERREEVTCIKCLVGPVKS